MKFVNDSDIVKEKKANRVLQPDAHKSSNYLESDRILNVYISKYLSSDALSYFVPKLKLLGEQAAGNLNKLSDQADRFPPNLVKRDLYGEERNEIVFHPAYHEMVDIAARSEMLFVKWSSELRKRFTGELHFLGFAAGQIFAMTELGLYCPLCMTDGAARLIDLFGNEDEKKRLIPGLSACDGQKLLTGAMFLTEKSGGSDVGANETMATKLEGDRYLLNGEKWFCSNANADVMMVLARTNEDKPGTRGLSLFLVEKFLHDGKENPIEIIRLKNKLGVKSMATAEIRLKNTVGRRLGDEGEGFKLMTEMVNLSRLYNSVTAVAGARRTLIEAYEFLSYRKLFGENALEHSLIRDKLHELGAWHVANFLLVWRTVRAMDAADNGEKREKELLRILIPMSKWFSAEMGVYMARESMELMGGLGYIEDSVMPRILRDLLVLPIWEGSGNVIVLDILRAMKKSNGLEMMMNDIEQIARDNKEYGLGMRIELQKMESLLDLMKSSERDTIEATAKPIFKRLIHLYQMALMLEEFDSDNETWIRPSLEFMKTKLTGVELSLKNPISPDSVKELIAWEF